MAVEYVKGVDRHGCLCSTQTGLVCRCRSTDGSVSPRASKKTRVDSILRLLGFVAEWYIDKVDVVEYTDVDWPRAAMNRASCLAGPRCSSPPYPPRTCEGATDRALSPLHRKAECRRRLDRDETYTPPATIAVPFIYIYSLPCCVFFSHPTSLTHPDLLPRRPMLPLRTQHHGYG